jgi:hypothetical protein
MATAKTGRARGPAAVKENGVKLEEGLSFFKSDKFDADAFVQSRCSLNDKVRLISFSSSLFGFWENVGPI